MTPKVVTWMNADLLWNGSQEQVWVKFSGNFMKMHFKMFTKFLSFLPGAKVLIPCDCDAWSQVISSHDIDLD